MKKILFFIVILSNLILYAGEFKMKTELVAPGTRSEGKRHILYYNDIAIPPEISTILTQNGKKYYYVEPKYTWSDAGWLESSCPLPKSPDTIELITKEELISGHYYSDFNELKKNTPKNWVFIDNNLMKIWISPEKMNSFLGLSKPVKASFGFVYGNNTPSVLWHKNFFSNIILKDDEDYFIVLGYELKKQNQMIYKISKKTGDIISKYPWNLKEDLSVLNPSITLAGGYLYSLSGSMKTGRFNVIDLKQGKTVFSEKKYFTHKAPIIVDGHDIFLAYSEADHKFSHLEDFSDNGKVKWHFRTRESIVTLAPLISHDNIIFFTNSMVYCIERK